jgi:hypothetical protein
MPIATPKGFVIATVSLAGCVLVSLIAYALLVAGYKSAIEPLIYYIAMPLCVAGWLALLTLPARGE